MKIKLPQTNFSFAVAFIIKTNIIVINLVVVLMTAKDHQH